MGELADELLDLYPYGVLVRIKRPLPRCRYCGKGSGLFWQQVGDKWQLFETRPRGHTAPHRCNRGLTPQKIIGNFEDIA